MSDSKSPLEPAVRHVVENERRISHQKEQIAELRQDGHELKRIALEHLEFESKKSG